LCRHGNLLVLICAQHRTAPAVGDEIPLRTEGQRPWLLHARDWLNRLTDIRTLTDAAYDKGALSLTQWSLLVSRSARIQDSINDRLASE